MGAGVLDHAVKASRATMQASRTCSRVASGKTPTTSAWSLELRLSKVVGLSTSLPAIK